MCAIELKECVGKVCKNSGKCVRRECECVLSVDAGIKVLIIEGF